LPITPQDLSTLTFSLTLRYSHLVHSKDTCINYCFVSSSFLRTSHSGFNWEVNLPREAFPHLLPKVLHPIPLWISYIFSLLMIEIICSLVNFDVHSLIFPSRVLLSWVDKGIYIYIYVCVHAYVYVYMYIYCLFWILSDRATKVYELTLNSSKLIQNSLISQFK
jgi:hypothetical protein